MTVDESASLYSNLLLKLNQESYCRLVLDLMRTRHNVVKFIKFWKKMNNGTANHLLCCNCIEPIMTVSFECTECTDLVLCGLCFCCGAELGQHKRVHGYRVHNIGGPCAFPNEFDAQTEAWTTREEFRMLDMIERYNLGDWEEVQKAVNPSRSPEEIQLHYENCYLNGRLGLEILGNVQYPKLTDHTSNIEVDETLSAEVKESLSKINPNELRLLAYMPDRDDYEKEYLNEAESIIANLIFVPDCSELDKEVILCAINMYIAQLRERCRAKSLSRDYDLVAQFFKDQKIAGNTNPWKYSPYDIRRMKEERELKESLKSFCQFLAAEDFVTLVKNLLRERAVKTRISDLQEYIKNGVTTLKGKKEFDYKGTPIRKRKWKRIRFSTKSKKLSRPWLECGHQQMHKLN
ncbi:Transcriptional adapter 2-beta [Trichinella pseudospiralis]|uniref:Transcriptional adapter 2-beta n=1 Tax=Trichinella pseudospiralis TaxID=6337 RepID=A0A0V1E2M7_TRIPS|nr:Transcriptional adapter 2-beta [Trichinella pseudospiralis]KRZ41130.1 Transcriptional adapter 2-beta [Trichinella pseudospiralis]